MECENFQFEKLDIPESIGLALQGFYLINPAIIKTTVQHKQFSSVWSIWQPGPKDRNFLFPQPNMPNEWLCVNPIGHTACCMSYRVGRGGHKGLILVCRTILNKPTMIGKKMAIEPFFGNSSPTWRQNHNCHYDSLCPIIDGRQLRIGVIVSQFSVKGGKMRVSWPLSNVTFWIS